MEYEDFKEKINEKLTDFYGTDAEIRFEKIYKTNNVVKDGIIISMRNSDNRICPTIYMDQFYEAFQNDEVDLDGIISEIIDIREKNDFTERDVIDGLDAFKYWDKVKEHVYPILISSQNNEVLLSNLVSTSFLDLAVIYAIRLDANVMGMATIKINKILFAHYGISVEELHKQAITNMKKDVYEFKDIYDVLEEIGGKELEIPRDVELMCPMFVLSNKNKHYGAAGLLNIDFIKDKCKGRNFIIIPSSLHETIFIPATTSMDCNYIDEMINEINHNEVNEEDVLSNHVYYYDSNMEEIKM